MLPRNKLTLLVLFFCLGFAGISSAQNQDLPGPDKNLVIQFFQEHISPVDGNRCTMNPSCSAYAAQAIQKHGLLMGWIMACDRLVRCGQDEVTLAPSRYINAERLTIDPVEANDFWWFNTSEKKKSPVK